MKVTQLKKILLREAALIGAVVAGFGVLYSGAFYYRSSAQTELNNMLAEHNKVKGEVTSTKTEVGDLGQSIEQFVGITEQNMPTIEGYDNTSSRIRAIRPIIEELKNRLKFATLDVTFAGLGISDNFDNDQFQVVDSTMEVLFTGPSDELVFSFIHEVLTRTPGFLEVKSLELRRSGQINDELLRKTADDRSIPVLVEGKVIFNWRTLKGEPIKVDVPAIMEEIREPVTSVAAPKRAEAERKAKAEADKLKKPAGNNATPPAP